MPVALASVIALAAWLGAAVLVGTVVAPAAFAVLPSRSLAGVLVGRVLPPLFWSGIVVGLAVAAASWSIRPATVRTATAALIALSCAASQLVVAPRIASLREQIGGTLDALDAGDPMRAAFGRLHAASVAGLGVAALSAIVTLVLFSRTFVSRSAP